MPKFGKSSKRHLNLLQGNLQEILIDAIELYDFKILSSHRGEAEQDKLFGRGASKKRYPNSKHNVSPSLAVDLAPYPIDWKDAERFYFLAGIILTVARQWAVNIRWGGDWDSDKDFNDNRFDDLGHYELVG